MQVISAALRAALIDIDAQVTPRVLIDCFEFYASDAVPGATGFDPNDALETFSTQTITWDGIAYRREITSRGDVVRNMGEKINNVTLNFSNISRYAATWAQTTTIEGLICVIRTVVPSVTDDSLVIFVGRCDKPSDIDKQKFTLAVRQDFGNINQELPPDKFVAEDPNGRLPGDVLYEGFRFIAQNGTFTSPTETPSTSFVGRLLGKKKKSTVTEQWSSLDLTPYGDAVPEVFGRCQMQGIPIIFQDDGFWLEQLVVWCKGPISSIDNLQLKTPEFYGVFDILSHTGELGGTGDASVRGGAVPHLGGNATEDFRFPGSGFFSLTAHSGLSVLQGASDGPIVITDAPTVVALIRGRSVDLPNSSGVYSLEGWSDNPVHIARFILTHPRFVNIAPEFMEDAVNYLTGLHCDEPLVDDTDGDRIVVPDPELGQTGSVTGIIRYPSTGIITPRYWLYNYLGVVTIIPEVVDGPYQSYALGDIPVDPVICPIGQHRDPESGLCVDDIDLGGIVPVNAHQDPLRRRYTCNVPITSHVRAVDFLYKTVFPAFKGFLRVNKNGKYEIRSEKASDSTRIRTATAIDATSVPVLNVTPWKSGDLLQGRLLTGYGLTTSEVRNVSAAVYSTSGNSITLVADDTGTITATASGATLTGGSTTVQASGTVTIGGTPAAGDIISVTIDGIRVGYILGSEDTTGTVAAMLTAYINANPRLNKYIKAVWAAATPTIITILCLHGALTVTPALLKAHTGPIADPTVAPTVASSAGALAAGDYQLAYSNVSATGSTSLTPVANITLTASKQIDVSALPAFPAGITSRVFYLSEAVGSARLRYVATRTDAAGFSVNSLPLNEAALPPSSNTTAEELIRVAMSFATNSQDVFPSWAPSTLIPLNEVRLPTVLNGHKYEATAITTGITAASEPTFPTSAGGTVVDGGVTWTEIGSTVLQQAGLTRANIVKNSYKWPLGSRQSSVNQIKGNFRDAKNDFALTPFTVNDRVHQLQVKKKFPLDVDLSAVDNFNQTQRIANWLLSKNREGDWFNTLETGPQGLVLEEGDIICASDDSGGLINVVTRIEEIRIKPNHDVSITQARRYSTLMFSDEVGAHRIPLPSVLRYTQTVDSLVEFIDNFPIRDEDGLTPGFYVAVSRDLSLDGDWRGWALYADYGDGYVKISEGDVPAKIGVATTTLGTVTDPSVFDRVNSVTFTLKYGAPAPAPAPFASVTEAELLSNSRRNLFLIDDEYVQAATVVDNGNQSYTISTLLRGRRGTDGAQLTHGASERVVYLDGAEKFVPIAPARLNGAYNYKAVTTNQDVADATPVSFTWTGGNMKPLAPVNVIGFRTPANDLLVEWVRRSRLGAGLRSLVGVPIAEEQEVYEIEAYSGSTVVRTWRVYSDETQPIIWVSHPYTVGGYTLQANGGWSTAAPADLVALNSAQRIYGNCRLEFDLAFVNGLLPDTLRIHSASLASGSGSWEWSRNGTQMKPIGAVGNTTVASGDRLMIEYSGDQVRYYLNYAGVNSIPLFISTTPPSSFPLMVETYSLNGTGTTVAILHSATIQKQTPDAFYTAEQQTADGLTPGDPVKVRIRQVSATVGRGDYVEATL